jgi:hypothetical protein
MARLVFNVIPWRLNVIPWRLNVIPWRLNVIPWRLNVIPLRLNVIPRLVRGTNRGAVLVEVPGTSPGMTA